MKTAALILTATLLFNAMDPALARAATRLRGADVGGSGHRMNVVESFSRETVVAVAVKEEEVAVMEMSRSELDRSKLSRGSFAYVVYRSEGSRKIASGKIVDTKPNRIVVQSVGSFESRTIMYADIETLAVAANWREIDTWQRNRQALRRLHAKSVKVMTGKELDLKGLAPGLYAYVVFRSNGVENAASGRVVDFDPHRVVIVPGAGKGWEIARKDIEIIAVSNEPGGIEQWRTARRKMLELQKTAMHAMSGDELDLASLNLGWHVHVEYRSSGVIRTVTGVIARKDANHMMIESGRFGRRTIRSDDIVRVLVTRKRSDMKRWRKARDAMRELQGPRVRLKAPSILSGWTIGRFAGSTANTLEILSKRGYEQVPITSIETLEVSLGRHRNTKTGMGIGLLVGLGFAFGVRAEASDSANGYELEELAEAYAVLVGVPAATLVGTLIGAAIETERWVEVSPSRINLSVSPTRDKGLRAAVSFEF